MAQKGDFQEVNIFKIKIKYCTMYNILVVMNKNTILIAINKYLFNHLKNNFFNRKSPDSYRDQQISL